MLRFDFDGRELAADAPCAPQSGLFHHGEEESRAGYSLGELLHLAQSTVLAQRVLAVSVLARLVARARPPKPALRDALSLHAVPVRIARFDWRHFFTFFFFCRSICAAKLLLAARTALDGPDALATRAAELLDALLGAGTLDTRQLRFVCGLECCCCCGVEHGFVKMNMDCNFVEFLKFTKKF